MASQRILILSIAGRLADVVWEDIRRFSDARTTTATDAWSPDDWPDAVQQEVDLLATRLLRSAYLPPVLYRSEHVDSWSMGDVFAQAIAKEQRDDSRQLLTGSHEIIATWVRSSEKISPVDAPDETAWLYSHLNEAVTAWSTFAEKRLIVLIRIVLGGLWEDDEVRKSLGSIPAWWSDSN